MMINGQNPKKNVPPIVSKSLARGINPWKPNIINSNYKT